MPLNGVMLMKQAGMAERRLGQPHRKQLHCSALEPLCALCPAVTATNAPALPRAGQAAGGNLGLLSQRNGQGSSQEMKADQVLFHEH